MISGQEVVQAKIELWSRVMAALVASPDLSASDCAEMADACVEEFNKRVAKGETWPNSVRTWTFKPPSA